MLIGSLHVFTIVLTFHEHKLGGLVRCHSRHGVPPSPFVTHTMRPCATTQIVLVFSSTKIDGSPTPFCPWGRPSVCLKVMATRIGSQVCSLIGTAAYSDIDFLLQVHAAIIANIVDSE